MRAGEIRPSRTDQILFGITSLADKRTLIAVGAGGTVLRSLDAGESWEARPGVTRQVLWGVTVLPDAGTLIAVGLKETRYCAAGTVARAGRHGPAEPIRI